MAVKGNRPDAAVFRLQPLKPMDAQALKDGSMSERLGLALIRNRPS
jgi:hypothetical protein